MSKAIIKALLDRRDAPYFISISHKPALVKGMAELKENLACFYVDLPVPTLPKFNFTGFDQ